MNYREKYPICGYKNIQYSQSFERLTQEGSFRENTKKQGCIVFMEGNVRDHIEIGEKVLIVLKKDQKTGILTEGVVQEILTKSDYHPHGIKVKLDNGAVGRVKDFVD